ncbi:MAG: ATPase [Bacteroidales bacterium]|jgi:AAA+ ATPase superfamily predicted ATPase|nr:ATPase [Bacteroidales bacterium]
METPFIYGRIAKSDDYTNRKEELARLKNNFTGLINTIIISPRRWGKTSLVNRVSEILRKEQKKKMFICNVDVFNCRTEEQFYTVFANAILRASSSGWNEFVSGVKKYLGHFVPNITLSDKTQVYEFSFGVDFKDKNLSVDEILNLPQTIAKATGRKIIVCIDEFQNIHNYDNSLAFQQTLRAHWQLHDSVCYCLFGSKRHLLMNIFNNSDMPFYKFGDILFLQKIKRSEWVSFISKRFASTGKYISEDLSGEIADAMQNHPYYVQQYAQQIWLRTKKKCDETILQEALSDLVDQLSLLFANIVNSLTTRQINFLFAITDGEKNFSSKDVLEKYDFGASANIKNIKNALLEKDLIDILPDNEIVLQDPVFGIWLQQNWRV